MAHEVILKLKKAARKSGGDRYEGDIGDVRPFVVYIPQHISREAGGVAHTLMMVIGAPESHPNQES